MALFLRRLNVGITPILYSASTERSLRRGRGRAGTCACGGFVYGFSWTLWSCRFPALGGGFFFFFFFLGRSGRFFDRCLVWMWMWVLLFFYGVVCCMVSREWKGAVYFTLLLECSQKRCWDNAIPVLGLHIHSNPSIPFSPPSISNQRRPPAPLRSYACFSTTGWPCGFLDGRGIGLWLFFFLLMGHCAGLDWGCGVGV